MDRSSSNLGRQPNGKIFNARNAQPQDEPPLFPQLRISPDFMPNGSKSLALISEYGLGLGLALGISSLLAVQLIYSQQYLWRLSFFVATLSTFHYLEFETTARYNPTDAKVSSFLLFTNGKAYNIAHVSAMAEVLLRHWLGSQGFCVSTVARFPSGAAHLGLLVGLTLIVTGQTFRSLAMKQAGQSFNHIVQSHKKEGHKLITTGVYAISRHPSYFGFFWWGLGTQLMLGNVVCLLGYSFILWKFFSHRIRKEEQYLISFFGESYEKYRERTPVLIPFIL